MRSIGVIVILCWLVASCGGAGSSPEATTTPAAVPTSTASVSTVAAVTTSLSTSTTTTSGTTTSGGEAATLTADELADVALYVPALLDAADLEAIEGVGPVTIANDDIVDLAGFSLTPACGGDAPPIEAAGGLKLMAFGEEQRFSVLTAVQGFEGEDGAQASEQMRVILENCTSYVVGGFTYVPDRDLEGFAALEVWSHGLFDDPELAVLVATNPDSGVDWVDVYSGRGQFVGHVRVVDASYLLSAVGDIVTAFLEKFRSNF